MNEPYSLTEQQWNVAHAIAQQLALEKIDVNELGKVISYLRAFGDREDAGVKFFKSLDTLARNGNRIGHSNQTLGYYKAISKACHQHLKPYQENPTDILEILGWAFRLTRYYKNAVPKGDSKAVEAENSTKAVMSERQTEISEVVQEQNFQVGQQLEATVTAIKGNKVTYQIFGTIKLTQKEPKGYKTLSIGQKVMVEILRIGDDGTIKKIKIV